MFKIKITGISGQKPTSINYEVVVNGYPIFKIGEGVIEVCRLPDKTIYFSYIIPLIIYRVYQKGLFIGPTQPSIPAWEGENILRDRLKDALEIKYNGTYWYFTPLNGTGSGKGLLNPVPHLIHIYKVHLPHGVHLYYVDAVTGRVGYIGLAV